MSLINFYQAPGSIKTTCICSTSLELTVSKQSFKFLNKNKLAKAKQGYLNKNHIKADSVLQTVGKCG